MSSYKELRDNLLAKYSVPTSPKSRNGDEAKAYKELRDGLLEKYSTDNVLKMRQTVADWAGKYNRVMQGVSDYHKKLGDGYTTDYGGGFGREIDALLSEYDNISGYANRMGLTNSQKYRNALLDLKNGIQNVNEYMAQFESEDAYNVHTGYVKKYQGQNHDQIQKALDTLGDGEEKDWLTAYQYDFYKEDPTYSGKAASGLKSYEAQKTVNDSMGLWQKAAFAYGDMSQDASGISDVWNSVVSGYRNDESYRNPTDKWNDNQWQEFGYLYAEDPRKAYAYAEDLNNRINAAEDYAQQMQVQTEATKDIGSGALHTVGALAAAPFGMVEYLDNLAEYAGRGTITQKSGLTPLDYSQAVQSGIGQTLNEKYGTVNESVPIIGGKGWGDVYNIGVSTAQSMLAANTVGRMYGGAGVLAQFFGQAGAAGIDEALSRGASAKQAVMYGTALGIFEGLTEKMDADRLIKVGSAATMKNYLLNVAKQMFGEGVEEGTSSLLGSIADRVIMQDKSEYNKAVKAYMANNMDEEAAKWQAAKDVFENAAFDALGGMASGGVSAGIQGSVGTALDARTGNEANIKALEQYGDSTKELIQEGLESDPKSESYKLAAKYQKQVQGVEATDGKKGKEGKPLTGFQIRNLVSANDAQFAVEDAKARLTELGETKDVDKLAKLVVKRATGQELSRSEKSTLARSQYGSKVAKEMLDSAKENEITYKSITERVGEESRYKVSESGQTTLRNEDEAIKIAEVSKIEDGQMTVKLEDGREVYAGDIDFANDSESYLYSAIADMENMTPAAATALVKAYDPASKQTAQEYANGIDEAYTYGYHGYSVEDLKVGDYAVHLPNQQMMSAYKLGQSARTISNETHDAPLVKMRTAKQAAVSKEQAVQKLKTQFASEAEVYYWDGSASTKFDATGNQYDEKRMAGVNAAKFMSKMGIGGKFVAYESYINSDNKRVYKDANGVEKNAPNGIFKASDGSIWFDLNAGEKGQGTTLYTISHELGHFVKSNSEKQFKRLADMVTEAYSDTDMTMHQRVVAKQNTLSEIRGEHVTYDEAFEEVVCDALSTMLSDGNIYEKIAELKTKDKGLFNTIKKFFEDLISKFKKVYAELTPDQKDAQDIRDLKEMFDKIQTAFAEALVEASDNFHAAEAEAVRSLGENAKVETNAAGDLLLAANERGNVQMYSERTYLNGGREKLEMALRQNGHTAAEIEQTLSYVDDALDYIKILAAGYAKNMGYTNLSNHLVADIVTNVKTGKQVMSAIVNNGDYPVNIDLSLICKKRVAYMNLMSRLIRDGVFDKVNYDGAAIAEVNEILRENGFETACLGCFVESRRLQFQTWAETIVSEWNAEVEKRNPNAAGFGFAKGKMEALTDADIDALTRELESVKKNDQGNVNLGQGNSVTRMGRLLDALPSLRKKLTVEDLLTPEGLTALRKHDGSLFSIVKSRYGAASPKIVQDFNPYASEIAMLTFAQVKGITNNAVKGAQAYVTEVKNEYGKPKKAKGESKADFDQRKKAHEQSIQDEAMRRYLYDIGGARIQSFSDFMIENVFDYIQIFADLAAKRLPLHGYTKEIVCMRLFGMTGAKWNGSLIAHVERNMGKEFAGLLPAGTKDGIPVTVDGKDYVIGFDDYARNAATGGKSFIQSIGMKDVIALQLDPRYSPYVGNITIGVSDAQILAMLDSPLFRMVIPYHASGMLPMFAKLVGVDMYNDYTDYQNTTVRQYYDLNGNAVSELKNAKGEAVKADTSYAFNAEIQKTKDAKTAAANYLKWCAQRHPVYDSSKLVGYATFNPKFSSSPYGTDFTRHENYYKLLEDFNTYDSVTEVSTVQGAVTMNFPSEENRLTEQQMAAYKTALRETGIFTEKDIEKYAQKANMTFKEIIAAEVGNRANYAATQAPKWESTVKAVEAKLQKDYARDEKRSDRDSSYMAAVNRGDMETAQRMVDEAAKAAGYTIRGNHGTTNLFTVFDRSKGNAEGDFGKGFYFTTNEDDVAVNYAASDGGDLTSKIEQLAENMEWMDGYEDMDYEERLSAARKMLDGGHNRTIKAVLRISNPVVVGGDNETFFDASEPYDEEADEYGEPTGLFFDLMDALRQELRAVEDRGGIVDSNVEEIIGGITETFFDYGGMGAYRLTEIIKDDLGTSVYDEDGKFSSNEVLRSAFERMGFDAIEDHSVSQKWGTRSGRRFPMAGVNDDTTHYIVFASEQVKQADPVTYDDSGNVIPLSERFNQANDDIRYSDRDSTGAKLTREQQEFFKNSKVRDENGNLIRLYHGTEAFGFTVIDFNKSDDGRSFFMTDNPVMAESYSGTRTTKSVVKQEAQDRLDPHTASLEDVVGEYNMLTDSSVSPLTTRQAKLEWADKHLAWANKEIKRVVEMFDLMLPKLREQLEDEVWGKNEELATALKIFEPMAEAYNLAANAVTADEMDAAHDALFQANKIGYDLGKKNSYYLMFSPALQPIQIAQDFEQAAKANRAAHDGTVLIARGNDYVFDEQSLRDGLEREYQYAAEDGEVHANYELYANLTNPLIIEAKGADWDNIRIPKEFRGDFALYSLDARPTRARTRDYARYAKAKGYDGVIIKDVVDYGANGYDYYEEPATVVIAFDSNQVKDAYNEKPTADPDLRYSDRDSAGNQLTQAQVEFFKDSKARDENGNLMVLYHGTLAGDNFSVFRAYYEEESDEDSTWSRRGVYTTTDKRVAGGFAAWGNPKMNLIPTATKATHEAIGERISNRHNAKARIYQMYANVRNPLIVDARGEMWDSIDISDYPELVNSGYWSWVEGDIIVTTDELCDFAYENEYDGVIVRNVVEGSSDYAADDVIVFSPEQLKYTDNTNPTSDPDIRFSERTGESVSNRALLANAFEGLSQNSNEYKLIQQYKGHIAELNSLEAKLSDFNQEISKIRFGSNGARDAEKLARLEDEARKIAEAINKYDKKLISLEASEPLRKVIEQERKKEAQKTKAHVQEIQQNRKVRAEQAELRHKIRKAVRDLDKLLKHGNKHKNVKEDLQPVVTKALKAADILFTDNYGSYDMLRNGIGADLSDAEEALVNTCARMLKDLDKMPTDGYDNFMARQEAENKLKIKMSKLKDVFARERKRLNNTTVSSILGELADAYATLEKSEQSYVQGAYSEAVHNFLKNLQSEVGGTIVKDMTKDQLESVYAAYKMVLTAVRTASKMFNEDLKMSREQLGNAVIAEVMKAGGTHGLWTKAEIARSQADWNNTKPIWVANRIGSETFGKLMDGLFKGQYNFAVDIEEAKQFKLKMDQKYHPRNWDAEKLYPFESSTGKKFSLNLQQIMSLYAFSKRGQSYSHLLNGGLVFEGNSTVVVDKMGIKRTYIHNGATSYKLNEATLNEIIQSLTKEQKAYVDEMQAYLSDVMGAKGNEVSMKLYGIRMFKEKFYFPLRSSGAYMEKAKEAELKKQQGQINLVNSGFTHAVVPEAKNPIILSGFMDVWAEHCNEMSMYHSMVLPMEDFRKVYNYSTIHDDKFDSASVYQTIQDAYGNAATAYIDQLYRELNAGATVDPRETPFKARISKFKKAAVMLSASVVVQQFSAVGRSYALIDPKYFIGTRVKSGTNLSVADEMKKYAPVAIIKEMGGFDTGTKGSAKSYIMAEKYGKGERIQGLVKDEQYRSDLMGILPAKADEKTWCAIWEAVKRETRAKHPKMDVTSEQFLKLAGERFSEVIEKTQVYDSVLARSANMRSKGAFMAMATAFMAEPTTTINLLEDALLSRSVKTMARAFGAVAVSIVLNNALASVVYAMRDDDEDETFIEKYFQSFASGLVDDINPMGYYPFLKDVYSLFQGYDVERADMSVIADLRDALKKAVGLIGKDTSEMDDDELAAHWKKVNEVMMGLLDAGCSVFGVPVKNVRRDAMGMINAYNTISKDLAGERATTWSSFWDKVGAAVKDTIPIYAWTKDKAKQDKLYDVIISGDKQHLARLKSGYKTDDAYHSAVRKALRENDSRIQAAAQAKYDGNSAEYKRLFREIQKEGKFGFDDIMNAILSEESEIRKGLKGETESSEYSATDFVNAMILGQTSEAQAMREEIISTKVANGKTREKAEEAFADSVVTSTRNAFDSNLLDEAGAEKMLLEYTGMDEEEIAEKISYWSFIKAHPKYRDDLSQSNVEKYHEFAEPAEIPLDVYAQYVDQTKGLGTIRDEWGEELKSKKEQVLEVIDSLPLTRRQKDALYYAAGYSESTISDAPW